MSTNKRLPKTVTSNVTRLLDPWYELAYVDHGDNLHKHTDILTQCIAEGSLQPLEQEIFDWYIEQESDSLHYVLNELAGDMAREFDVSKEQAKKWIERHQEELEELIHDRDRSNPLDALLRNTCGLVFFYDTGLYVEEGAWAWDDDELAEQVEAIATHLGIELPKGSKARAAIESCIANASYGGQLGIFFNLDGDDLERKGITSWKGEKMSHITFRDPMVAIVDYVQGSGYHAALDKVTITLPYRANNLILDKAIKYSYTYQVCGMYSDWCGQTGVELSRENGNSPLPASPVTAHLGREAAYNKTWREGKCSFGDMDIHRHHDLRYINDFPCGMRCGKCGTFWID